jgi:hypothetical protein
VVTPISFVSSRDEDLRGAPRATPQTDSALGRLVKVYGQSYAKSHGLSKPRDF